MVFLAELNCSTEGSPFFILLQTSKSVVFRSTLSWIALSKKAHSRFGNYALMSIESTRDVSLGATLAMDQFPCITSKGAKLQLLIIIGRLKEIIYQGGTALVSSVLGRALYAKMSIAEYKLLDISRICCMPGQIFVSEKRSVKS